LGNKTAYIHLWASRCKNHGRYCVQRTIIKVRWKIQTSNSSIQHDKTTEATINLGPIKCIGQGLHDYVDDGTFAQWLKEYPCFEDEAFVIKEAITSPPQEEVSEKSISDNTKVQFLSQKMEILTLTEELQISPEQTSLLQQPKTEDRSNKIVEEPIMANNNPTIEVPIPLEQILMAKQ